MADDGAAEVLLRLTIDLPPLPKGRPRTSSAVFAVVNGRRVKVRDAHTFTPQRTRDYEEKVGWALRKAGARPVEGPVGVELVFHTDRRGDADNMLKAILDAANGICFRDDSQVEEIHVRIERDTPARTDLVVFRRNN